MPAKAKVPAKRPATSSKPRSPAKKPRAAAAAPDWRAETLHRVRKLMAKADAEIVEEVKWRKPSNAMQGVPVWSRHGIICTGETYKDKVKLTFMRGRSLDDPAGLLNAGLDGGTRRAIDIREGEPLDAAAFTALVRSAVAANGKTKTV